MNIDIKYDIETEKKLRFLYGCVYHEDYAPQLAPTAISLISEAKAAGRIWSATFTPRTKAEEKYLREVIEGMNALRSA